MKQHNSTDPVSATRADLAAATARHAELSDKANAARQKVTDALAGKQAALDKAAAGEAISSADLRAADEAVRDAVADAAIADAVASSGKAAVDRALIALRESQARAIEADSARALADQAKAVAELDAAMHSACQCLARVVEASGRATAAHNAAQRHNHGLQDDARDNALLSNTHSSVWPKARVASGGVDVRGLQVSVTRENGEHIFAIGMDKLGLPVKAAA